MLVPCDCTIAVVDCAPIVLSAVDAAAPTVLVAPAAAIVLVSADCAPAVVDCAPIVLSTIDAAALTVSVLLLELVGFDVYVILSVYEYVELDCATLKFINLLLIIIIFIYNIFVHI